MTNVLTDTECALLQRYYDGDPLDDAHVAQVQQLLNGSSTARVFMSVLEELTVATQAAEDEAWSRATAPDVARVVEIALQASALIESSLEELAPLLERFFDAEVVDEEMIAVQALINERDDVADYLATLDGLRASVRVSNDHAIENVSFDGFWDSLESRLEVEPPASLGSSFDVDEHRVMLYRYHDDEADTAERARVDAWLVDGEPTVIATLAALSEVRLAAVTAVETAQERVDFSQLWHQVENAIDDGVESQGDNVVSLARQKRERTTTIGDSRALALVAIAAMLFAMFGASVFKDQLFGSGERVIVEKTIVIVDSVEYQPGSSVMVNTPMRPVSSISAADDSAEQVEEEPTVIWLLDGANDAAPPSDGVNEGNTDADPTSEETSDQPI